MDACGLRVRACVHIYIYTKPRQQKFRAMNGAHLASPIRGELNWLCSLAPAGNPIYCPIGHQIWGPLGKQDVCPNFALTATKFLFSNSGNFRAKADPPKPRSCPKRPFGQLMGQNSSADWVPFAFHTRCFPFALICHWISIVFLLYGRRIASHSVDPSLTNFLGEFPGLGRALVPDVVVPEAEQRCAWSRKLIQISALAMIQPRTLTSRLPRTPPFSRLLRHAEGYSRTILTPNLQGY